ncbi:hypothetical protein LTR85_008659 [Meristemomyces frigidus]|nr:hypothetical protein LTR85_008659 [Meristemomyces frigidus]
MSEATETLNLVEASIADLQRALSSRAITSVELVAKYLLRIATYDSRGPCLNSIVIFNPDVFDEAAASDARRDAGHLCGPLDGIPYTIKDSMKYQGMTCATGSPAFEHLVANEDSFVAEQLRKAGAVCIGRTNTPPMMASGMHRGLYGRAESPYNLEYLTAAFSSGSSNGSATSTAASFAAFGLGSETVSSGRSPASNNGLVAYTPSRTVISPRGVWPLYPTCDVLVPHTRTVEDMLAILDVLTVEDRTTSGDFWRQQTYIEVPKVERPASYLDLLPGAQTSLRGKRIGVPKMYIGGHDPKAKPTVVSGDVVELWRRATADLGALGAIVVETDFPLVTNYEDDSVSGHANNVVGFKPDWNGKERGELVAYLWDDFLKENKDPRYPDLATVDGSQMFPRPDGYIPDRYMEKTNFMNYPGLVEIARERDAKSIWDIDGVAEALPALEAQRKRDLEDWMDNNGIDVVAFPANGDVGKADLDTNEASARHALQNGVKYSNGNRAFRHMGVPTVSVSMGFMSESRMPVNLTFAGKHGQDSDLLQCAFAFEKQSKCRVPPPVTPSLATDHLELGVTSGGPNAERCGFEIMDAYAERISEGRVRVSALLTPEPPEDAEILGYVNGVQVPTVSVTSVDKGYSVVFEADFVRFEPSQPIYGGFGQAIGEVIILILVRSEGGAKCKLMLLDQDGAIDQRTVGGRSE